MICWLSLFFFCKQKTAYEMRISDWSSDVCSSDLLRARLRPQTRTQHFVERPRAERRGCARSVAAINQHDIRPILRRGEIVRCVRMYQPPTAVPGRRGEKIRQ